MDSSENRRRGWTTLGALGLAVALAWPAAAPAQHGAGRDQDRARSALRAGRVLPLKQVLALVRRRFPGRVLDAELRAGEGDRPWRYEIRVLSRSGRVSAISVDAASGRLLGDR